MSKLDTKVNPCQTNYVRVVRRDCWDPSGLATLQLPNVSGLRTHVSGLSKSPVPVYQINGYQPVKCPVKKGASQGIKVILGPTRGFERIHVYVPVHSLSRIPRLWLVHPVDISHTKFSSVTVRVNVE